MCFHSIVCNYLYILNLRENSWISESRVFCGINCDFVYQYYHHRMLSWPIVNWRKITQKQ